MILEIPLRARQDQWIKNQKCHQEDGQMNEQTEEEMYVECKTYNTDRHKKKS